MPYRWPISRALACRRAQDGQGGEVRAGRRDGADANIDRHPALPRPVDVLEVQQQRELIHNERQARSVAHGHGGMPAAGVLAVHRDRADAGQHPDPPQVVVQVLASGAEITERATSGPDAQRDAASAGEGDRECEPAEQRGPLARVQFLVVGVAQRASQWREACHMRTIRARPGSACSPRGQKVAASRMSSGPVLGSVPRPVNIPPKFSPATQTTSATMTPAASTGRVVTGLSTPAAIAAQATASSTDTRVPWMPTAAATAWSMLAIQLGSPAASPA